jgi:hypothetical protein
MGLIYAKDFSIPMEDMDVVIFPQRRELAVHTDHPYFAQMKLK